MPRRHSSTTVIRASGWRAPTTSGSVILLPAPQGGGIDDTAAINAIMTTPSMIYRLVGGARYTVNSELHLPASAVLTPPPGLRTELHCSLTVTTTDMIRFKGIMSTALAPATIQHIDFTGANAPGIYVASNANNCYVSMRADGSGNPSGYVLVDDCTSSGSYGDMFTIQDRSHHGTVQNSTVWDSGRQGVSVTNGDNVTFRNIQFGDPTKSGIQIHFSPIDLEVDSSGHYMNTIDIESCTRYCDSVASAVAISGPCNNLTVNNCNGGTDGAGASHPWSVTTRDTTLGRTGLTITNNNMGAGTPSGASGTLFGFFNIAYWDTVTLSGNTGNANGNYGAVFRYVTNLTDAETAGQYTGCVAPFVVGPLQPVLSPLTAQAFAVSPSVQALGYQGQSSDNTGLASSQKTLNFTQPPGSGPGSLVLIMVTTRSQTFTWTTPTAPDVWNAITPVAGSGQSQQLFWRKLTGTETWPLSIVGSATGMYTGIAYALRGTPGSPFDPVPSVSGQINSGSAVVANSGITTTVNGDWLVWFGIAQATATGAAPQAITIPAGFTVRGSQINTTTTSHNNIGIIVADATQSVAGATGAESGSVPVAVNNGTMLIGIQ